MDPQLGQALGCKDRRPGLAGGEEQHDSFGLEPAGNEDERPGRGVVEPVRVVDDAKEWTRVGPDCQEGQRRRSHDEPLWHGPAFECERRAERARLVSG